MNARTLTVFRLYQFFNGIIFTGPIWAVFLLSRGLSLTQFGIVEASLHVGMLIAQVPTGALADALGRRRLLVAAGLITAVAELRAHLPRRCGARRRVRAQDRGR